MRSLKMPIQASFVHANIVARDWKKLSRFYEQVFGCTPVPPERDLSGLWLEVATGIPDARIRGIHLRLPGWGDEGPTLEVFQYEHPEEAQETAINQPGIAHLAFAVQDVESARQAVIRAGGGEVGEVVTLDVPGAGEVTFVYMTDPEGNIIELQRWS
jgi:predicted enzyme related to lactoylglutathione lyase